MRILQSIAVLFFQVFITCAVLFVIYFVYALFDIDDVGFETLIGFAIFQPIFSFILISVTVCLCLIIGLPIRLIKQVKLWWVRKPAIPIVGVIIGLLLLASAMLPFWTETRQLTIDGVSRDKEVPNFIMAVCGWLSTAFCLLHFFPHSVLLFLSRIFK